MPTDALPEWLARKVSFAGRHAAIPEITKHSLKMWVLHAQPPGGFVEALLRNDLMDAYYCADDDNRAAIPIIVDWLYNECPRDCLDISHTLRDASRARLYKFKGLVEPFGGRKILDEDDGEAP